MRTRSRSRHKIAEPLRIEFPSQEDQFHEDPPEVPMADNRTMAQLLQAPTAVVAKVNSSSSTPAISSDVAELKDMVRALLLDKKNQSSAPAPSPTLAPVKAVESNCVTCEMARTPINEHCSAVLLNKLPKKLGDPGKFLIPCEFLGMGECLALADLGASINLMPLCTGHDLIDVHKSELTLRIRNEAITYNLDQTMRYSANFNQMTANKIDVIREMYSPEVLGFFDVTASGNPTPYDDPIVSTTSPTLTSFGDSDFLLFEEADAFLGLEDDPNSPMINPFYYNPEGDILLLEAILNSEPLPPLTNHEQYMPSFKKELKVCEAKTVKSSVDEPPKACFKGVCWLFSMTWLRRR
nr:reverse transcriptase domain-containing protein [Tanacetum cinerariifolium]